MSVILTIVCLAFLARAADPLYALRVEEDLIHSIVSTDPSRGYMTHLIDLSKFLEQFPELLNITTYDANTDTFAFANVQPPLLALCNTLAKKCDMLPLPEYGKLLSITAYDGSIYALYGLDEDLPTVGRLITVDLETRTTRQLAKWKLADGQSFYVGTPMAFLPQFQNWMIQLQWTQPMLLSVNGTTASLTPTGLPAGWTRFWSGNVADQQQIAGFKDKTIYKIDLSPAKISLYKHFQCAGTFAVDFKNKFIFDLTTCNNSLIIETATFANKTVSEIEVDPSLAGVVSFHASNTYIPFGCGSKCGVHTDCEKFKSCNQCRLGKCSDDGNCGSYCFNGADCFAGVCAGNCEDNRCGRKGCASACENHEDCKSKSKTCQVCRLGRCCDAGECGNYCLSPTDCYGGSCLAKCTNYRCSP